MKINLVTTSASRLLCLTDTIRSLKENLKFSGEIYGLFHEDVLDEQNSNSCLKLAREFYDEVYCDDPPLSQSWSLDFLFKKCTCKYVLNWEDDWELIRPLDLDEIIHLMEIDKSINQVAFHKRDIMSHRYDWKKKEVIRQGIWLTTNPHWAFTPSIFRREFLMKFWKRPVKGDNPVWFINNRIKQGLDMPPAEWMMEHVGAYFLGRIGEGHYVEHLGFKKSVRLGEMKW